MSLVSPQAFAAKEITLERLVSCSNAIREEQGLSPLNLNEKLTIAANQKLEDMSQYQYWAHHNPETNKKAWEFIDESTYNYTEAGENLAIGFQYSEDICEAWKNSPAHRDNLLKGSFEDVGFGIQEVDLGNDIHGKLIVQFFGKEYKPLEQFLSSVTGKKLYGSAESTANKDKDCYNRIIPNLEVTWPPCQNPLPPLDKIIIYNPKDLPLSLELNKNPWKMKSIYSHGSFKRYNPQVALDNGHHELDLHTTSYPDIKQRRDLFIKSNSNAENMKVWVKELLVIDSNEQTTTLQLKIKTPKISEEDLLEQNVSIVSQQGEKILKNSTLKPLSKNSFFTQFSLNNELLEESKHGELVFNFITSNNERLVSRSPFNNHYKLSHHLSANILSAGPTVQISFMLFLLALGTLSYSYWYFKKH